MASSINYFLPEPRCGERGFIGFKLGGNRFEKKRARQVDW
jgi:hypothetical protein